MINNPLLVLYTWASHVLLHARTSILEKILMSIPAGDTHFLRARPLAGPVDKSLPARDERYRQFFLIKSEIL